jgi:anaerobic selenocysteine-containing dehydrogenase
MLKLGRRRHVHDEQLLREPLHQLETICLPILPSIRIIAVALPLSHLAFPTVFLWDRLAPSSLYRKILMANVRLIKGCCPLDCQDTCSWVAHVEDERVVRLEGAREHPFTRGTLCAKVNDYFERTYAPDRLLYPLRRTGPKGSGVFERITWDQALSEIAERFAAVIDEHGSASLLPVNYLGSMGVVQRRALLRLFHALGASRFHGSICGASGNALEAEGHPRGFDPEEIVHSRFILLWGANVLTTGHHQWHFIEEARKRHGARIICIDPIRTRTADRSDEHLAIRPGTDRFLAAGIARILFEEDLSDLAFAGSIAADLESFRTEVASWAPERVAEVCGIDAEDVLQLGREFGRARPALIRAGVAPQQTVEGEAFVRSLSALAILGGHWNLPGGGLFIETNPVLHEARAARPDLMPGAPRSLDLARLGETLTDTSLQPPIHGLMIWGTNPAVVQPNAGMLRKGLARENLFTVVIEHFLTDTARFADIILPSTTQLEHFDIVGAWGHHYISVNNPAVAPLGETKSHGETMRLLAQRMGMTHPALQESDEEIAASALPEGVDLRALQANGWRKSSPGPPYFGPDREKLRLSGISLDAPARTREGLLQLLTPKSHFFMNSSFANMARQRRAMHRPTLDMNPADAASRGLSDGDRVSIRNAQGEIHAWIRVTDRIRPDVVALPGKWWGRPAENGAVANVLSPSAWSPGGQPAYNETFVEVTRAPEPAAIEVPGMLAGAPFT